MSTAVSTELLPRPTSQPAAARLTLGVSEAYAEHAPRVWRSLRRLGVPDSLLEDALQDVFLVVHRRWAEFEGRAALTTWIYGIVLRVAKDHRRSEQRRMIRVDRLSRVLASETDTDTTACPAEAAERREANHLMHAVLAELPDELRQVLVLVELEGLSVREASGALGVRPRTCHRRLNAAREAFNLAVSRQLEPAGRSTP
ncbi:MAG: RNA polymerase sigma factor [Polyangiaceae bacterium]|nr:RNA polymerase sigma factor [Polyangiaceae bacterium]